MKTKREQFEAWFFSEVDGSVIAESLCWQAWQAAIESIVVELPPKHEFAIEGHDGHELIYALNQAGIKYE